MSPRVFVILSVVVALTALPDSSPAQSITSLATPLTEGTRVRVSTAQRREAITGVVVSHSADSLVVKADGDSSTIALPAAQVARLEISRGKRTQMLKGARIGVLSGAALGALAGYAAYEKPDCGAEAWFCIDFGPGFDAAVGAALVGAVGALVGTLLGNQEEEQWRPAPHAMIRDARLGVAPVRGGVALTASLAF